MILNILRQYSSSGLSRVEPSAEAGVRATSLGCAWSPGLGREVLVQDPAHAMASAVDLGDSGNLRASRTTPTRLWLMTAVGPPSLGDQGFPDSFAIGYSSWGDLLQEPMRRRIVWRYRALCKCRRIDGGGRPGPTARDVVQPAPGDNLGEARCCFSLGDVGRAIHAQFVQKTHYVATPTLVRGKRRKRGRSLLLSPTKRMLASGSPTTAGSMGASPASSPSALPQPRVGT